MAKKLVYTTNTPSATTDYAAADGTWKTIGGGGGGSGTVTSVALTAPAAFNVTGSPITTSGTIAISGAGTSAQYIDGTGALQTTPTALPPSGSAGGDLNGTYPNPTVDGIHGIDMQSGTPSADDVWVYGGSPAKWQHQKLHASQVTNDSTVGGTNVDDALDNLKLSIALKQDTITLTTTGTNGSATLVGSTLNIPQYAGAGSGVSYFSGLQPTTLNAAQSLYTSLVGGAALSLGNEPSRYIPMVQACALSRLYVRTTGTQPSTGSAVITLRKNGADTALAVTIAASSAAGTYTNTATSISFADGDLTSLKLTNNSSSTLNTIGSFIIMVTT
jgi:hypothetical protein